MEQRNLILALALSMAILIGFQLLFPKPPAPPPPAQTIEQPVAAASREAPAVSGAPAALAGANVTRDEALARSPRVVIDSPRVRGSIALQGGRIDDLRLRDYRETLEPNSPQVLLLSPPGAAGAYYGEFGWIGPSGANLALPGPDTVWTASGSQLSPATPLRLTYDNGAGLRFTRTVRIDENYLFTVSDRVENQSGAAVTLYPYGLVSRTGTPKTLGYYILHEGPLGVLDGRLVEVNYKDLKEQGAQAAHSGAGGWVGITDKYWLVAVIPDQNSPFEAGFRHTVAGDDKYQTDFRRDAMNVAPGATAEVEHMLFAGAKEVATLEKYRARGIERFDLAVDWGWFFFLTKPIFLAIDYLYRLFGNFGIAIIVFTIFLRLLFFPLANRSFKSMAGMRKIQPEVTRVREAYANDRERQTREVMDLYKKAGVNPLSGCLPILLQIPVFFALYKVLFVTIEMRHAPFYGWIRDLSAPDPTTIFNLFGLIPWDPPFSFLHVGLLPILMGITMYVQQKLNPAPPDPIQQRIFMLLPVIFTFVLANFPAGLVIYWTVNNILSMTQQWIIMRRGESARLPKPTTT